MDDVRELLKREFTPEEYADVRELWKAHSIAEDGRDLEGLVATLTPDCAYEVVPTGHRWEGHDGARAFYRALLGAFPDVRFELENIVIGPQGVCEEARLTGTHERDWLEYPATGRAIDFQVVIFFPWDPEQRLFRGERVHFDPIAAGLGSAADAAG
ncbi:MAG TPA: nuclear transport factor 2 family protein [Gemmatimonadota bacterium]|nr:nuclear transport factor 2 family protein [Gemmatimonadota bacterium]